MCVNFAAQSTGLQYQSCCLYYIVSSSKLLGAVLYPMRQIGYVYLQLQHRVGQKVRPIHIQELTTHRGHISLSISQIKANMFSDPPSPWIPLEAQPQIGYPLFPITTPCLGGAVVGRRTRDRKVSGSITPGRGAIKSTSSTQPCIPSGYVN